MNKKVNARIQALEAELLIEEFIEKDILNIIESNIDFMIKESKRKDKDKGYRSGCEAATTVLVMTKIKIQKYFECVKQ